LDVEKTGDTMALYSQDYEEARELMKFLEIEE
jgi:hypothetical protein